ncbi:hypothetical protein [Bradyrhizobium sp. 23AC]
MVVHHIFGGTPTSSLLHQRGELALDEFYATPNSEQKARFNTQQQLASP